MADMDAVMDEVQEMFPGMTFICELPPGDWKLCSYRGHVLAVCPEHPPRIIHPDGTVEILTGQ